MPNQTVTCPECGNTITVNVPLGERASLIHGEPDTLRISARVLPISQPSKPFTPTIGVRDAN